MAPVHRLVRVEAHDLRVEGGESSLLESFQVFVEGGGENVLVDGSHFLQIGIYSSQNRSGRTALLFICGFGNFQIEIHMELRAGANDIPQKLLDVAFHVAARVKSTSKTHSLISSQQEQFTIISA